MSGALDRSRGVVASGPLYPRLLRLKHIHPSAWQRAVLVEGSVSVGAVAALSDRVTAWTPLVLPVAVAAVVKFHDVLTGILQPTEPVAAASAVVPTDVETLEARTEPRPRPLEPVSEREQQPQAEREVEPAPEPELEPAPDLAPRPELEPGPAPEPAPEHDREPVAAMPRQPARPGPLLASPAAARAELDALADAALRHAQAELTRRGGLEPFVMRLDARGDTAIVNAVDVLTIGQDPDVRAVVVARDVALTKPALADAVRLELEHATAEPELVTVIYRRTGIGPDVVLCERTRETGRRSGVQPRFFAERRRAS